MKIHSMTSINTNAKIGKDVEVGPFSTIEGNVEIGDGTWIGSNVTIMDGARIGKNCKIFPGAVISAIPQDLKYRGEETVAIIGDNTTIRECVTVNKGTVEKMKTQVGDNCLIMAYSHIAHDCIVGNGCILANCATLAGHVILEDYVLIGGITAVVQFLTIGKHSMIAGGSIIRKDVPPFVRAASNPLVFVGVNSIGLRRHNFSSQQISQIQDVYRYMFYSKLNMSMALEHIEKELSPTPERDLIINFVRNSKQGIIRASTTSEVDD